MKNLLLTLALVLYTVSIYGQSKADSIAIVSAQWVTTTTSDGIIHKRTMLPSLYKGPQHINLIEIPSGLKMRFDIGVSKQMKPISQLASERQALAAINGSFYNMQKGNSVCYLQVGKQVVDTTTTKEFRLRVTGAIYTHKKKVRILPWSREIEKEYHKKKGTVLASGPLLLENGEICYWET